MQELLARERAKFEAEKARFEAEFEARYLARRAQELITSSGATSSSAIVETDHRTTSPRIIAEVISGAAISPGNTEVNPKGEY